MPSDVFSYDSDDNTFVWRTPPFGGAGDDNTAIYNFDKDSLADQGLYKLWRDGSGGYYTVSSQRGGTEETCSVPRSSSAPVALVL